MEATSQLLNSNLFNRIRQSRFQDTYILYKSTQLALFIKGEFKNIVYLANSVKYEQLHLCICKPVSTETQFTEYLTITSYEAGYYSLKTMYTHN